MFTAMRPQILFPLFAEVSTLKGVGPRALPLVHKVAGPLVREDYTNRFRPELDKALAAER